MWVVRDRPQHFASKHGLTRQYPKDLLLWEQTRDELAKATKWIDGLGAKALRCRVAVLSECRPERSVVHAAHESVLGISNVWVRDLSQDQARLIASGPKSAFDCPYVLVAEDTEERFDQDLELVTQAVAAQLLCQPVPGEGGIPGIPVDSVRRRELPWQVSQSGFQIAIGAHSPKPVNIAAADLDRHLYVCGKTGVGKTTLLKSLIGDLAEAGEGMCIIDPHGDLALSVRKQVKDRRVVWFDPTDPKSPGMNPLDHDGTPAGIERVVEDMTAMMFRLYPRKFMGPMFDRHSRALLMPLLAARKPLWDMSRMATDESFRQMCLDALDVKDPLHAEVHRFWEDEYTRWSSDHKGDMQAYTVSKYDGLVRSSALRRTMDPSRPQLDLRRMADQRAVLIARLPQGITGPVSAFFLGMQIMSRLQQAIFSRADVDAARRPSFTLIADEFQNFLGGGGFGYATDERTLGPLLSESRKYGLRMVLANQYVSQMDDGTRDALFGNVGSLIAFRLGAKDSNLVAAELGGEIDPRELRDLPLYTAVARVLVEGRPTPLFNLKTVVDRSCL